MRYDSLYIHAPFCARKCDYCAFFSVIGASRDTRIRYLQRLDAELVEKGATAVPLRTLFIGGGTPTQFTAGELEQLMLTIHRHFDFTDTIEFTVEANPSSLTAEKLAIMGDYGVNRVSLGVESFAMRTRKTIGRSGGVSSIFRARELLVKAELDNFSCDLIYAVPGQTLDEWSDDLNTVLQLQPSHVSTYALSIESGTELAARGVSPGDDDTAVAMWNRTNEILGQHGIRRYEISNYSRPGAECQHNIDIWYGKPFVGGGPAACWYDGAIRWANPADLNQWLVDNTASSDVLPATDRALEILVTGLRMTAGWSREHFITRTGMDYWALREAEIKQLAEESLLVYDNEQLRLTEKGMLFANYVAVQLM